MGAILSVVFIVLTMVMVFAAGVVLGIVLLVYVVNANLSGKYGLEQQADTADFIREWLGPHDWLLYYKREE